MKSGAAEFKLGGEAASAGKWHIFDGTVTKKVLGIFTIHKHLVRVVDRFGVVSLQREGLGVTHNSHSPQFQQHNP